MVITDNTRLIKGVGVETPFSQLLAMGYGGGGGRLSGLGDFQMDPSSPPVTSSDVSTLMTAFNAEAGYLTNLYRANAGLPPLPAYATQPGVTVGLDPMLLLVGGGLLLLLISRTRR